MPAGDFSARSVRSSERVKPTMGALFLDPGLPSANLLKRVAITYVPDTKEK